MKTLTVRGGLIAGFLLAGVPVAYGRAQVAPGARDSSARLDSAFRALQDRGRLHMGVDQYTSAHQFEPLPDGGRIALQREVPDSAGVAQIRRHLRTLQTAFEAGDFGTPAMVHDRPVPGTQVMTARRARIQYTFRELPQGGEIRLTTSDPAAIQAIHEFLAFQNSDHRTGADHQHQ
ncbi:MAG: hypothetical protein ABI679_06810 [Gemmatimonadota bacterium]